MTLRPRRTSLQCYQMFVGSAIVRIVCRWLPIAADWVRARLRSCGICGGQSPCLCTDCSTFSFITIIRGWCSRRESGRHTKWTGYHPHSCTLLWCRQGNHPRGGTGALLSICDVRLMNQLRANLHLLCLANQDCVSPRRVSASETAPLISDAAENNTASVSTRVWGWRGALNIVGVGK
jgi:hypothetical protein